MTRDRHDSVADATRVALVRFCGDDPVAALMDAGIPRARARQLVEGRGRQVTAGELWIAGEYLGILPSDILRAGESAVTA